MAISEPVRREFHHDGRNTVEPLVAERAGSALLYRAAADALRLTDAAGVAIAIEHDGVIRCAATAGDIAPAIGATVDRSNGITGECVLSRMALQCADTQVDPRVNIAECASAGIRSVAVAPILYDVRVIGIVEAFSGRAGAFTDSQVEALERIAADIARSYRVAPASGSVIELSRATALKDGNPRPPVQSAGGPAAAAPFNPDAPNAPDSTARDSPPVRSPRNIHVRRFVMVTLVLIAALGYFLLPRFPKSERAVAPSPDSAPTPLPATSPNRSEPPQDTLRTAGAGDPVAEYRMGLFYLNGDGAAPNHEEAFRWFHRAAQHGQPDAQYRVASAFANGDGTAADLAEAYAWYVVAQSNGNADAGEAIKFLTARFKESDIATVRFRVGQMYARGEGTRADPVAAFAWLALAESAGHPSAGEAKAQLAKRMDVQQLADATARASLWLARHRPASP